MTEPTDVDRHAAEFIAELVAALTPDARDVIAILVERRIQREYGQATDDEVTGCTSIALAGVEMSIHRTFVRLSGTERGVKTAAGLLLRQLVGEALAARLCHCSHRNPVGCPHGYPNSSVQPCTAHYEADVPAIDDMLLCGTCYQAARS